jgi:hypothetical protein
VQAYVKAQNLPVDPERFVDYYASNGWRLGSSPIRDWKAVLRNWGRRQKAQETAQDKPKKKLPGVVYC